MFYVLQEILIAKSIKGPLLGARQFLPFGSPLKVMKNAFYFTLKALSFSRYVRFCLDFSVMYKNGLIRNIR